MRIEQKLQSLGLALPQPIKLPAGLNIPFAWTRSYGDRVYVSGHAALNMDGSIVGPFGRVGAEVSAEAAYLSARAAALAILASVSRELGDLDRVEAWLMVSGMVNIAPGFIQTTNVINGCSDLLLELYGDQVGRHARTAIGVAQLPQNVPVVIAAEIAFR